MKYLLLVITFFTLSCKAQIVSLETMAKCREENPTILCPDNWTYEKDINNLLDKYIGIWKGNFNGKYYEINLKKGLYQDLTLSEKKSDILVGRLRVTDPNLNIYYNNFSELNDDKTNFSGLGFQSDLKAYKMYFVGNSVGCAEYGDVYLRIQHSTPSQMTILMLPDNDIVVEGKCPTNFQPTIPYKQLIHLVKQ
ncbi:DUF6705 family protein [Chryseobacterium luquanense]|uniref:DUF6705 family protein n=1 Tax=Chryseobacterium luquanense TaxID=2983766 RepID=UPI00288077C5|nr:DUF6705 family protein [Chryseobacterium luquanense]